MSRGRLALLAIAGTAGSVVALRVLARPSIMLTDEEGQPIADATGAPLGLVSHARSAAGVRGAAHTAPPTWEPGFLSRLGRWQPEPPATPVGRLAAYVWAAPLSLAGLLAAATSGARPTTHEGVLLFSGARGLPGQFFSRLGYSAFTLGHVIVAKPDPPSPALLVHELVHTRQAERLGPLMAPIYLLLRVLYGYARNPMERAARRAQAIALGAPSR